MRIYLDTDVFGAYPSYMAWHENHALDLFAHIRAGHYRLVTSIEVEKELLKAPVSVQDLFVELMVMGEWAHVGREATDLRDAYLSAAVVTPNHRADAFHVAIATVARCDALATWNASDFVNKMDDYNHVNIQQGYDIIQIQTPDVVLQLFP